MNVYESCRTCSLSLSLPLRRPLPLLLAERAVSTHTECFIEIYDYPALCGYERPCARLRVRTRGADARAYTRGHGGERRGPCQFLRASTYALHTYRAHFFASPLLHIIRANNILCIICMPYAAALRAKSRNREPHRSACPIGPISLSLSFFFVFLPFPYLSFLDRTVTREREELSPFSSSLRDGSNPLAFFSRVYFSRIPKTKEGTKERRNVHPTVNDFGEYIWWERKRFESIVHIRPCTIGIAQIHLGDWSYK